MPELRSIVQLSRLIDDQTIHFLVANPELPKESVDPNRQLLRTKCRLLVERYEEVIGCVDTGELCPACVAELAQELRALRFIREEEAQRVAG